MAGCTVPAGSGRRHQCQRQPSHNHGRSLCLLRHRDQRWLQRHRRLRLHRRYRRRDPLVTVTVNVAFMVTVGHCQRCFYRHCWRLSTLLLWSLLASVNVAFMVTVGDCQRCFYRHCCRRQGRDQVQYQAHATPPLDPGMMNNTCTFHEVELVTPTFSMHELTFTVSWRGTTPYVHVYLPFGRLQFFLTVCSTPCPPTDHVYRVTTFKSHYHGTVFMIMNRS